MILLSFTTLMVAASGNIINDMADESIDRINRTADKLIIGQSISLNRAKKAYFLCILFGMLSTLTFCVRNDFFWHFWVYPFSILALYFYTALFKCMPLLGNIVVAAFTAGAVYLPYYAFQGQMDLSSIGSDPARNWILQLSFFAFLSNLLREWVKDREDYSGDLMNQCQSTSVFLGKQKTYYLISLGFLTNLLFCLHCLVTSSTGFMSVLFALMILLPLIAIALLFFLNLQESKYKTLSNLLKIWMILGFTFYIIQAHGSNLH
jgi:4-hydroxybenzoate polyprenyltransferase